MPESTTTFERITCADVQVGDIIARAKSHPATEVLAVEDNPSSRWLTLQNPYGTSAYRIRPGYAIKLWRVVR